MTPADFDEALADLTDPIDLPDRTHNRTEADHE